MATNCTSYGVLITQSYPASLGTPGNGVIISVSSIVEKKPTVLIEFYRKDVNFYPGTTILTATSDAYMVAVDCGEGSCTGMTDLHVTRQELIDNVCRGVELVRIKDEWWHGWPDGQRDSHHWLYLVDMTLFLKIYLPTMWLSLFRR